MSRPHRPMAITVGRLGRVVRSGLGPRHPPSARPLERPAPRLDRATSSVVRSVASNSKTGQAGSPPRQVDRGPRQMPWPRQPDGGDNHRWRGAERMARTTRLTTTSWAANTVR